MKKKLAKKIFLLYATVFCWIAYLEGERQNQKARPSAVTYALSGGRLGDNIISMLHAAWISHIQGIDLVINSFAHADQFAFYYQYPRMSPELARSFTALHQWTFSDHITAKTPLQKSTILYVVPYFPDFAPEWNNAPFAGPNNGPCCVINWSDRQFIEYARSLLKPTMIVQLKPLPHDAITVAVHIRRGTGFDPEHINQIFPHKFPPIDFYVAALKTLAQKTSGEKIFAYVFTDDPYPKHLVEELKSRLASFPIEFACREEGNAHDKNVIEDFFGMQQYACIIHPLSNYSYLAAKLGESILEIEPHEITLAGGLLTVHSLALYERINGEYKKTIISLSS